MKKQKLKKLKELGLHVAVETTGQVANVLLQQYDAYIDLYLWDIKHYSKEKYSFIGGNLDLIIDNVKSIDRKKVIARIPVIHDFNLDELETILRFVSDLGINEVHLLPFHRMGEGKYRQMQVEYQYKDCESMPKSILEEYIEIGRKYGLLVKIGG